MPKQPVDKLLTPGEVAKAFRVNPKTVTRWAEQGLIPCIKTPGGHRRFKESDVQRFLEKNGRGEPTNDFDALKPTDGHGPNTPDVYRRN